MRLGGSIRTTSTSRRFTGLCAASSVWDWPSWRCGLQYKAETAEEGDQGDQRHTRLMPRLPRGWKWDQQLATDILRWAPDLQWMAGEVTFAQLVVYFKLTGERERTGRVPGIFFDPCPTCDLSGGALMGALSAVQLCGWLPVLKTHTSRY